MFVELILLETKICIIYFSETKICSFCLIQLTLTLNLFIFLTKINNIHSFKLIEYIDTIQIQIR